MTRILVILAIIGIVAWRRRPVSSQADPADELPFRDPYLESLGEAW